MPESVRPLHLAMSGAAAAVLLIACVNLAHLMLARGIARRRDFALWMALGARRSAIVGEMFLEALLITAAGAALGGLLTTWAADIVASLTPRELKWLRVVAVQFSWRVYALAAAAMVASALLFGLAPAIRVARSVNVTEPLQDSSGTTTGRVRHRYNALVITEVALALVLVMGGGLLLRSVRALQRVEYNFPARHILTAMVGLPRLDSAAGLHETYLETARRTEGVEDAALLARVPLRGLALTAELSEDSTRTITMQNLTVVSPSYLRVMGLPILRGRDFEPGDAAGPGVAVLDPVAAARLYGNADAVGRMIQLGAPASGAPWIRVIGIARSPLIDRADPRGEHGEPHVWVVRADARWHWFEVLVRAAREDPALPLRLRDELRPLRRAWTPGWRRAVFSPACSSPWACSASGSRSWVCTACSRTR